MKIAVVGTGYVGLVSAVCFAELGNQVIGVDIDQEKINMLNDDIMPIWEPGLKDLVVRNKSCGRIEFTTNLEEAVNASDVIFIAVGTPSLPTGEADMQYVYGVAEVVGKNLNGYKVVVDKSTVPVGTADVVKQIISDQSGGAWDFDVVSAPEFLREGTAIKDTMEPERIIIGCASTRARDIMEELHRPFGAPILFTDLRTAEMIKYASNAFLAVKISFINEIANICEEVGADVIGVADGMGYDRRIGRAFLSAGVGFGGSCFPKDTSALVKIAEKVNYDLKIVKAAMQVNNEQRKRVVIKLSKYLGDLRGKTVGLLGLAFKPNTDDMRYAPAIDIASELVAAGANVKGYDPVALGEAQKVMSNVLLCDSLELAVQGTDAVILLTEWEEFVQMDVERVKSLMKGNVFIDGRNVYSPEVMRDYGFDYHSVGRR